MGQDHGTTRKGPWTEHEDFQLMFHVHMFGDRRWDFIAGVSGLKVAGDQKNIRKQLIIGCNFSTRKRIYQNSTCLKRTGKSCRLRWVNYLNPGLKRGKLAPHEERLVLELHSKFGNRWSKIAQKLPGRTDNEIKNYWRTHMRKRAQEKKRTTSTPLSSSLSYSSSSSSICTSHPLAGSMPMTETKERSFYDTGGVLEMFNVMDRKNNNKKSATRFSNASEEQEGYCSMDDIWKDIELSDDNSIKPFLDPYSERAPLTWDICMSTNSWMTDGQEEFTKNTFNLATQQFSSGVVD